VLKRSDLTKPPSEKPSVPVQVLSLEGPSQLTVNQFGTFTAKVNEDATPPLTYNSWDFGDGTTASTLTARHSYTKPGNYTVTFVVSNQNSTDKQSKKVKVERVNVAG
ncbi:MAG: PKD domain-containing protein, partial [Rivularia sp. ALOHA_DT_140]|nr:PKD domain-containing protein [Rivularia sp. ALOHA_DT_140]